LVCHDEAFRTQSLSRQPARSQDLKASVRAKVEHPFQVVKNRFHYRKMRYRGLAKNTAQLFTLFGFANLLLAGRRLRYPNPELRLKHAKRCNAGKFID
jgi:IS5 family transposase